MQTETKTSSSGLVWCNPSFVALVAILLFMCCALLAQIGAEPEPLAIRNDTACATTTTSTLLQTFSGPTGFWSDLLLASDSDALVEQSTWDNYESKNWEFVLQYPPDWQVELLVSNDVFMTLAFSAPREASDINRNVLLMTVADMSTRVTQDEDPYRYLAQTGGSVHVDSSTFLNALFLWRGKSYSFSQTHGVVIEQDASTVAAIIRSLQFICPEQIASEGEGHQ